MRLDNRRYDTDSLRAAHTVEDVIRASGVELKPSGKALVGLCPLHSDGHRPNLYVYPLTRSWYCYRCQLGGDVIKFVQLRENVGFVEACERLNAQPPIPRPVTCTRLAPENIVSWEHLSHDDQLLMDATAAIYQESLWHNERALSYVRWRGLTDATIHSCGVGYSDGVSLDRYLARRGRADDAQRLGLLTRRPWCLHGVRTRELLAGRVVVPEQRDGHAIWFIARAIDELEPKYLALPHARPLLGYGTLMGQREALVCEGVFDFLSLIELGRPAVALCGTHLPLDRLALLREYDPVVGLLDPDDAGRQASQRLARFLGDRFRSVELPDGCDVNELTLRSGGQQELNNLISIARRQHHEAA